MAALVSKLMEIDPELELRTIAVFLEAAREPGITFQRIALNTGISLQRVSVCALKLSKTTPAGRKSYGLVRTYSDGDDPRIKHLEPTDLGARILSS